VIFMGAASLVGRLGDWCHSTARGGNVHRLCGGGICEDIRGLNLHLFFVDCRKIVLYATLTGHNKPLNADGFFRKWSALLAHTPLLAKNVVKFQCVNLVVNCPVFLWVTFHSKR